MLKHDLINMKQRILENVEVHRAVVAERNRKLISHRAYQSEHDRMLSTFVKLQKEVGQCVLVPDDKVKTQM